MDLNRLTRDADDLIRKVVSRYNTLYVPAGTISQVELDLMLEDIRRLYDTFKTIGQVNLTLHNPRLSSEVVVNRDVKDETQNLAATPAANPVTPASTPEPAESSVSAESEPVLEFSEEPILTHEAIEAEEPEEVAEFQTATVSETENIFTATATETKEEEPIPVQYEKPVSPISSVQPSGTLADKFNTGNKSFSESMATSQGQGGVGARILFHPISDLTTGIGLNEKFHFIAELFGNNAVLYEEAITRINKAVNLDEANWILQKYHSPEWEMKQDGLIRLKEFIKRRFM